MQKVNKLEPAKFFHIYNRGNGGIDIFKEEKNYNYFLILWNKHIEPIADTYAYCLLKNHFHFLVQIKSTIQVLELMEKKRSKQDLSKFLSQQFSNCFNAYAKAFNKKYGYSGSLFEERFRREPIEHKRYLSNCIKYIHRNPEKHGFVDDFQDWSHSSFDSHLSQKQTKLMRKSVLELFGDRDSFAEKHNSKIEFEKEVLDIFISD